MPDAQKKLKKLFLKSIFLGSFNEIKNLPNSNLKEYCFIGRSNVGKSSIINAIAINKNLAKTSKTPGRTQSINIFEINKNFKLVDLPGYGYAKLSKALRSELYKLNKSYISNRLGLEKIFVLIDCSVGIKNSDINMLNLIESSTKNFTIILTKIDKCSKELVKKQLFSINSLMNNYKNNFDQIFTTSSKKNLGITKIQKYLLELSK